MRRHPPTECLALWPRVAAERITHLLATEGQAEQPHRAAVLGARDLRQQLPQGLAELFRGPNSHLVLQQPVGGEREATTTAQWDEPSCRAPASAESCWIRPGRMDPAPPPVPTVDPQPPQEAHKWKGAAASLPAQRSSRLAFRIWKQQSASMAHSTPEQVQSPGNVTEAFGHITTARGTCSRHAV